MEQQPYTNYPRGPIGFEYPPGVHFEFIGKSFERLKENVGTYAGAALVAGILFYAISFLGSFAANMLLYGSLFPDATASADIGKQLLSMVIQIPFTSAGYVFFIGMVLMGIDHIQGRPVTFRVFDGFKHFPTIFLTQMLVTLITYVGLALLIIPGFWVSGALSLAVLYAGIEGKSPMDAIRASLESMRAYAFPAFGYLLVLGIVAALGACACGIGLLFTGPIFTIGMAYLWLANNPNASGASGMEQPIPPMSGQNPFG